MNTFQNPVVVLDKSEYDALVRENTHNGKLLGIYLNALRYMIRLYHVEDEAWDTEKRTEDGLRKLLEQFGLECRKAECRKAGGWE